MFPKMQSLIRGILHIPIITKLNVSNETFVILIIVSLQYVRVQVQNELLLKESSVNPRS